MRTLAIVGCVVGGAAVAAASVVGYLEVRKAQKAMANILSDPKNIQTAKEFVDLCEGYTPEQKERMKANMDAMANRYGK